MRHFHRTTIAPNTVISSADTFFPSIGLVHGVAGPRVRNFSGVLGTMTLSVRMEGGHYTFVEVHTDQAGESRLDKNVKKFFNVLHRQSDPRHRIQAGY